MEIVKIVLSAVGAFAICAVVVYIIAAAIARIRRRKRKRKKTGDHEMNAEKKAALINLGTMDVILIFMAVVLILFTLRMIELFEIHEAVPDTLITCVFGLCGGECGFMGWIKTSKEKYRERQWMLEDQKKMDEAAAKEAAVPPNNDL